MKSSYIRCESARSSNRHPQNVFVVNKKKKQLMFFVCFIVQKKSNEASYSHKLISTSSA